MRTLVATTALLFAGALAGCSSCKRTTPPTLTAIPDKPPVDSGADADADEPEATPPEVPKVTVPPEIACTTSPRVAWLDEPKAQFSCSDLRTPKGKGTAAANALEFTVSPGTELAVALAAMNDKHLAFAPAMVRYQLEGAPASAKIDAGKFKWKVNAMPGSTFLFEVAAHVKLTEGERCVKQPIVVHVEDDEATRAHQIANKLRMNAFFRTLDCQWAHQGPDLEENGNNDAADEKSLRESLACGSPMVKVVMKDLNGDGSSDAIVTFTEHAPTTPPSPPAHWETGPGVQIHLRKGDDFVFAGEAPGELVEADDGTNVILDTNQVEHSHCPPRPYKSTGYSCDITHVEVRKLVGTRIEWVGEHDGHPLDALELGTCPSTNLVVKKDGKGRLVGFLDGTHLIPWNEKTPQSP